MFAFLGVQAGSQQGQQASHTVDQMPLGSRPVVGLKHMGQQRAHQSPGAVMDRRGDQRAHAQFRESAGGRLAVRVLKIQDVRRGFQRADQRQMARQTVRQQRVHRWTLRHHAAGGAGVVGQRLIRELKIPRPHRRGLGHQRVQNRGHGAAQIGRVQAQPRELQGQFQHSGFVWASEPCRRWGGSEAHDTTLVPPG
ncbi:hypothetical protein ACI3L1_05285 [Deinococcus sp. SM5_A1]|uniref:hypothetical protein n=1 Tax=Deinococcus sp. SM5_A1 TaxID=3379094 RepID=UPI003858FB7E